MDDFAHGRNVTALPPTVSEFTWDTKIHHLLPEKWAIDDVWATEKANVRDILTHVSGLTRFVSTRFSASTPDQTELDRHDFAWQNDDSPLFLLDRLPYMKMKYELREKWSYNNLVSDDLGALVVIHSRKDATDVHHSLAPRLFVLRQIVHGVCQGAHIRSSPHEHYHLPLGRGGEKPAFQSSLERRRASSHPILVFWREGVRIHRGCRWCHLECHRPGMPHDMAYRTGC